MMVKINASGELKIGVRDRKTGGADSRKKAQATSTKDPDRLKALSPTPP
jgi:hypothetical protein